MGTIRKKKTSALTRMSGFRSIVGPDCLYPEAYAKKTVVELQAGDPDWKWEAMLKNQEKNLWAIQLTDEDGNVQRFSP